MLFFSGLTQEGWAQSTNHQIKSGETLSGIAKKYNTTVAELIRLNPDASKGLKAGEALKLREDEKKLEARSTASCGEPGHTVKSGESLYKIAKKYKVTIAELEQWNGITNADLKVGQALIVSGKSASKPTPGNDIQEQSKEDPIKAKPSETEPIQDGAFIIHKVVKGETLSGIAKKEKVTIEEIKKANDLRNNNVNLGQDLKIPVNATSSLAGPKQKVSTISAEPTQEAVKSVVPKEPKPSPTAPLPAVSTEKPVIPESAATPAEIPAIMEDRAKMGIREVNNTLGYTRVVETGFAEAIEGDVNPKKHLCLHKTAPIGSILQVKNEMNGQSVFVKVIGKLPETGSNEKLIIRISKQAYERLLAAGKRFPVEVSYPEGQ